MFGIDKKAIKKAFVGFHERLAAIEASTKSEKKDVRLDNIEQLIKDLSQAFD